MPDKAHAKTDRKIEQMEKRLSGIYSGSAEIIEKKAADYFRQFERLDEKKRKQVEAGTLTEAEYKRWRKNKLLYAERFKTLQSQIATDMLNVNKTAIAYVNGQLPEVYAINYNSIGETVDGIGGYSFTMVDANTVKELATRNSRLLPYKYIDQRKDKKWNMQNVHRSVLQSILTGESIPDMAKRLRGVEEMNRNQSIRTARTLTTAAENKGRQDGMEQAVADGIILEKFWIATYDKRTRDWHEFAGGRYNEAGSIPIDEPFLINGQYLMHPGDSSMGASGSNIYNCRCTMGTVVKGFEDEQVEKAMVEKQVEEPKKQGWDNLPDDLNERMGTLDKLIGEEIGSKGVFNGKILIDNTMRFDGTANYDGSITLRSKASRKTEIHELLHQHSEGGQNRVYVAIFKNIEEGSVELLAQEICHAKGIKIGQFDYSYTPYVDALRQINKLSGAYKTDYDFARAVFGKPLEKRAEFLKSLGDTVAKDEKRFFRGALKTLGVK